MVNQALAELSGEFQAMYSSEGRPSIPPEKLLRALLLQVLYTIRSERLLMEQLDYNLLFRWFVGLSMDDKVWDHSVFSKNQERFLGSDLAAQLFFQVVAQSYERQSLIMTTNLDFSQWPQVFGSEQLTGALLDRLTHHAHILIMNGESFRFRRA